MNKLRLIRIYELRGKIHPIEQYVIDILDGIEKIDILDGIDKINYEHTVLYNKDNFTYFNYSSDSNIIWLSYYLETIFKTKYGCSYEETKDIMKYLLEKHLKLTINEIY